MQLVAYSQLHIVKCTLSCIQLVACCIVAQFHIVAQLSFISCMLHSCIHLVAYSQSHLEPLVRFHNKNRSQGVYHDYRGKKGPQVLNIFSLAHWPLTRPQTTTSILFNRLWCLGGIWVSFTIFSHHVWKLGLVHGQGKNIRFLVPI